MDNNLTIPTGRYHLQNDNAFVCGDVRYVLKKRRQTLPNKPKNFLIALSCEDGHYLGYVSSLYTVESTSTTEMFEFDYCGAVFVCGIDRENKTVDIATHQLNV